MRLKIVVECAGESEVSCEGENDDSDWVGRGQEGS